MVLPNQVQTEGIKRSFSALGLYLNPFWAFTAPSQLSTALPSLLQGLLSLLSGKHAETVLSSSP